MMLDRSRVGAADATGERPAIVIIGGGLSGAATAWYLARKTSAEQCTITIVEPRAEIGSGLAYSTADDAHRINVPAARMSIDAGDLTHFARWIAATGATDDDPEAISESGDAFPRRAVFGRYVAAQLDPYLRSGRIAHVRGRALSVARVADRHMISLATGESIRADLLVIATTHPPPAMPPQLGPLTGSARLVPNLYAPDSLRHISPQDRVLIVGAGLTSADAIASLDRMGHLGRITVLSRHGYRSAEHGPVQPATTADFAHDPARTTRRLLRRIRAAVQADASQGLTWHATLDQCRSQGGAIWSALPLAERRRLVRHLRAAWDVHRFRIAPQPAALITRLIAQNRLHYVAGRLVDAAESGTGLSVTLRPRGAAEVQTRDFDRVIVTTGPALGSVVPSNPVLASLARLGLARPDTVGLGVAVDAQSRTLAASGCGPGVFISGPLARGQFGELMGVPEVTAHAEQVADHLIREMAAGRLNDAALV